MKRAVVILFLLSVFLLGFLPVKDTDFGWHYRCGNQLLSTGELCLTNEFSYFLPNYKAYYTGHLYDIILALVYNQGGFLAVSILGAILFALSGYIFFNLIRADLIIKVGTFFASFFLSYPIFNLGFRPQIISYLFLLILLWILQQENEKYLYVVPFLFLIWTNLHIGFFIGLIVLLFYFRNWTIVLLSFLVTLINPFRINVYREIMNHAFVPLNTMIAEWVAPNTPHVFLVIGLSIIGSIKIVRKNHVSFYHLFLLLFFGVLALKARRNLPFFYTTFAFVFLNDLKINLDNYLSLLVPLLASLSIFVGMIQTPQTILHATNWNEYCNKSITMAYPCQAINKFPQLSGNIYAMYEWGGFLIWQKPDIKIFTDGRMPAWKDKNGKSPYQVYLEIIQTQEGWNEKLRSLETDYIFVTNGTFLDLLLVKDAQKYGWIEVYRDDLAVIYQNSIIYL